MINPYGTPPVSSPQVPCATASVSLKILKTKWSGKYANVQSLRVNNDQSLSQEPDIRSAKPVKMTTRLLFAVVDVHGRSVDFRVF